jgi:uncharacterized protein DUF4255/carboxypeptidase family protein
MLDQLDNVIRTLLMSTVPGITTEDQVRFQPPDDDWRTAVANLGRNALNVYLVDMRENRRLNSTEWLPGSSPSGPTMEPPPARVDCHYLLTAWSPASVSPAIEPTVDEHRLLYQALAALYHAAPLNPTRIYPPGSVALATIDPLIRDVDLPTLLLPSEGFHRPGEFWGTMGTADRWKPSIHLVVTLPVVLPFTVSGPMVTTRIMEFRQTGKLDTAEVWTQIGGAVLGPTGGTVSGAHVRLETGDGGLLQSADTAGDGRFTFGALRTGPYRIHVVAPGLGDTVRPVTVPSSTGEYDVQFT